MEISPFQQALKNETQNIHDACENHPLMQSMINGTCKKEHLLLFLTNILPFYKLAEEKFISICISNNWVSNNTDLFRSSLIEQDINILQNELQLESTPVYDIVTNWVQKSQNIMPLYLKAELYVRWLADLYGGQILKNTVEPNNMYNCLNVGQTIEDVRKMLEWGPPLPRLGITANTIIGRAKNFFQLHLEIFDQIYRDV